MEWEFFEKKGYLVGPRLLSDKQIEMLNQELGQMIHKDHTGVELWHEYNSNESKDPTKVLFHALGAWRIGPSFHDLLFLPRLTAVASQLLKAKQIRLWHDQLFVKPAHHGGVVARHQDYSYWTRTAPMQHLTCWIALDDANTENGCLHYVPGSHTWTLLPITGLAGDMVAIRKVLTDDQWDQLNHSKPMNVKAGTLG